MRTINSAAQRSARYDWYWFIDRDTSRCRNWVVRRCRETGHPFDAEKFAEGNYYPSFNAARSELTRMQERDRAIDRYIARLRGIRYLTPEQEARHRRVMERRLIREEQRQDRDMMAKKTK